MTVAMIARSFITASAQEPERPAPFPRLAGSERPTAASRTARNQTPAGVPGPLRIEPTLPDTFEEQDPERWDGLS